MGQARGCSSDYKTCRVNGKDYRMPRCKHGGPKEMTHEALTESAWRSYYTNGVICCDRCQCLCPECIKKRQEDPTCQLCEKCSLKSPKCKTCTKTVTPEQTREAESCPHCRADGDGDWWFHCEPGLIHLLEGTGKISYGCEDCDTDICQDCWGGFIEKVGKPEVSSGKKNDRRRLELLTGEIT